MYKYRQGKISYQNIKYKLKSKVLDEFYFLFWSYFYYKLLHWLTDVNQRNRLTSVSQCKKYSTWNCNKKFSSTLKIGLWIPLSI